MGARALCSQAAARSLYYMAAHARHDPLLISASMTDSMCLPRDRGRFSISPLTRFRPPLGLDAHYAMPDRGSIPRVFTRVLRAA